MNALLALGLLVAPGHQADEDSSRYVDDAVFVSEERPALEMEIPEGFSYMGSTETLLLGSALAERHHFASVVGRRIDRLIILQFEHYIDGAEGQYNFVIPGVLAGSNYRFSPRRIDLGGFAFVHNTWAFDFAENVSRNPDTESADTLELIRGGELRLDAEVILSRFVTEVGPTRRAELILFYMEPLAHHGLTLDALGESDMPRADYDAASRSVTQRSLTSFDSLERRRSPGVDRRDR